MDPIKEEHYLQLALSQPNLLCSEAPLELLADASSVDEPTKFLKELLSTGYTQWLLQNYGPRVHIPEDQIDNAVIVLWLRACRLHTSHILGRPNPEWDKPFFSDEGLY